MVGNSEEDISCQPWPSMPVVYIHTHTHTHIHKNIKVLSWLILTYQVGRNWNCLGDVHACGGYRKTNLNCEQNHSQKLLDHINRKQGLRSSMYFIVRLLTGCNVTSCFKLLVLWLSFPPWWTWNCKPKHTLFSLCCFGQSISLQHREKKLKWRLGTRRCAVAMANLIAWFVGLWNCFVAGNVDKFGALVLEELLNAGSRV